MTPGLVLEGPPDAVRRFRSQCATEPLVTLALPPGAVDAPVSRGDIAFTP